MSNKNYDCKHLSTTQRIKIEKGLMDSLSFAAIARSIGKHPSTVAKEVKKYQYFPDRSNPNKKIRCTLFDQCQIHFLCEKKDCVKLCKPCFSNKLNMRHYAYICPNYQEPICKNTSAAPFVCNGCQKSCLFYF